MLVVCLNGPREVGKTTIANMLAEELHPMSVVMSVAEPMKDAAMIDIGLPADAWADIETVGAKDVLLERLGGKSLRMVLVEFGKAKRAEDPYWLANLWRAKVADHRDNYRISNPDREYVYIMPDCRFHEEYRMACDIAGRDRIMLVHVARHGYSWKNDIGQTLAPIKGSKSACIYNTEDIAGLRKSVRTLAHQLRQRITDRRWAA